VPTGARLGRAPEVAQGEINQDFQIVIDIFEIFYTILPLFPYRFRAGHLWEKELQKKTPTALKTFVTELESPRPGCGNVALHIMGSTVDLARLEEGGLESCGRTKSGSQPFENTQSVDK